MIESTRLKMTVFDEDLLKRAIASKEQIKEAQENGVLFVADDEEEGICLTGYRYAGAVYITDVKHYDVSCGKEG